MTKTYKLQVTYVNNKIVVITDYLMQTGMEILYPKFDKFEYDDYIKIIVYLDFCDLPTLYYSKENKPLTDQEVKILQRKNNLKFISSLTYNDQI